MESLHRGVLKKRLRLREIVKNPCVCISKVLADILLILHKLSGLNRDSRCGCGSGRVVGLGIHVGKQEIVGGAEEVSLTLYAAFLYHVVRIVLGLLVNKVYDHIAHIDAAIELIPIFVIASDILLERIVSHLSLPCVIGIHR